jgi:hypothetical protein
MPGPITIDVTIKDPETVRLLIACKESWQEELARLSARYPCRDRSSAAVDTCCAFPPVVSSADADRI